MMPPSWRVDHANNNSYFDKFHMHIEASAQKEIRTGDTVFRPTYDSQVEYKLTHWLVQIMTCRLVGAKPLSEPMLEWCYLDLEKPTSVKF